MTNVFRVLEVQKEETTWGDPGIDGSIILKWISEKQAGRAQTAPIWSQQGSVADC
jgi:hypothetical protein